MDHKIADAVIERQIAAAQAAVKDAEIHLRACRLRLSIALGNRFLIYRDNAAERLRRRADNTSQ